MAGVIVGLDQASKYWISQLKPAWKVIPGFFNIHYVENTGAAFGILHGKLFFLVLVSIVAAVILTALIFLEREKHWLLLLAFACILGGTCGNLIDRIRLRYVVDFLQVYVKIGERYYFWPSFNIADSAITIGVGVLILFTLRQEQQQKKPVAPLPPQ